MQRVLTTAITIIISVAMAGFGAAFDGGNQGKGGSNGSADALGCDDLSSYLLALGGVIIEHPTYTDWFIDDDSPAIDELKPAEAEDILDDGEEFIVELGDVEVPPVYTDGHEGIVALFQFFNDTIGWVVLEEGDEPDTDDLVDALDLIIAGENAAADGCPDQVETLGGAVFMDPDTIDVDDVPDDPGDVDKNFL